MNEDIDIIVSNLLIIQSIIRYKHQKHFNQFTKSLLFCVILFYRFFLVSAAASVGMQILLERYAYSEISGTFILI